MKRAPRIRCTLLAILCALLHCSMAHGSEVTHAASLLSSWDAFAFKIENTQCRVGIASVKLSVSKLTPKGGNLVATYSIDVPLSKSSSDTGLIVLPIELTVDQLGTRGGTLTGVAYSNKEGATPNKIICEVRPHEDQGIRLSIITDKRTLRFKSRYTVIATATDS